MGAASTERQSTERQAKSAYLFSDAHRLAPLGADKVGKALGKYPLDTSVVRAAELAHLQHDMPADAGHIGDCAGVGAVDALGRSLAGGTAAAFPATGRFDSSVLEVACSK